MAIQKCDYNYDTCPGHFYCDSGTNYCLPCSMLCTAHQGTRRECEQHCPDYLNDITTRSTTTTSTSTGNIIPTYTSNDFEVKATEYVLFTITVVLVMICILAMVSLGVLINRRHKKRRQNKQIIAESDVILSKENSADSDVIVTKGFKSLDNPNYHV